MDVLLVVCVAYILYVAFKNGKKDTSDKPKKKTLEERINALEDRFKDNE